MRLVIPIISEFANLFSEVGILSQRFANLFSEEVSLWIEEECQNSWESIVNPSDVCLRRENVGAT